MSVCRTLVQVAALGLGLSSQGLSAGCVGDASADGADHAELSADGGVEEPRRSPGDGGHADHHTSDASAPPEPAADAEAAPHAPAHLDDPNDRPDHDDPDAADQDEPHRGNAEILTQRYDNARTGANLNERMITQGNVHALTRLGSWSVDAEIYAQVLVAADVQIAGDARAVAIVATMNNTVYAFDADADPADAFLWQQGLHGELGTPSFCARNIAGPNGILSTPVIDKARGHVYLVARDCDPQFPPEMPQCEQRLFRLALDSGDVLQSVTIQGEVLARDAQDDEGEPQPVRFVPSAHWNRPGLLLQDDTLVVAFGSGPAGDQHEEDFVYHGWAFRYQTTDLTQAPEVYCTTPHGRGGSVWQAGAAPAADERGVYLTGANGIQADSRTHPPDEWPSVPADQQDSVVRLPREAWPSPQDEVAQYWDDRDYLPQGNVFQHMESGDNGFGSSGPLLIPDTPLLLVGTKAGLVYLVDRETMQSVQPPLSPFTELELQPGHTLYLHGWWGIPMITQTFVFWRPSDGAQIDDAAAPRYGFAYAWASNDRLRQLRYDYADASLQLMATAELPAVLGGGNLVLSASQGERSSGVLWATTRAGDGTGGPEGTLWAFDPLSLELLWQDQTPAWSKFNPPTVVRGRVFVPSTAPGPEVKPQVLVYGLPHEQR